MKLVIDERFKHRLIGLAVILSIAAIFAPAIMKKSNQNIDGNVNVSVELPPKPAQPDVAMVEKKEMFETTKVAHVEIPDATEEQQPLPTLTKAEPLSQKSELNPQTDKLSLQEEGAALQDSANLVPEKQETTKTTPATVSTTNAAVAQKVAQADSFLPAQKSKIIAKNSKVTKPVLSHAKAKVVKPVAKKAAKKAAQNTIKGGYSVQLATFTQQRNAESLISRLKQKGYAARSSKVKTSAGIVYKVIVGRLGKKEQAQQLQKRLASAVQMHGFIISTDQG